MIRSDLLRQNKEMVRNRLELDGEALSSKNLHANRIRSKIKVKD